MKIVARSIKMIAWFTQEGIPEPLKFAYEFKNKWKSIKVDNVIEKHIEKLAGNRMYVFECQSTIQDELIRYQLKYELESCKWILFKI